MKLQIILGSTRPGRAIEPVGKWVADAASQLEGVETEILDLRSFDLPLFDEPVSPRYNPERTPNAGAKAWLDKLAEGDAYLFITPEYNHSVPGALKNALDYLDFQAHRKPAAIVSYGTVGGARAAEHLKNILSEGLMIVIPEFVALVGMPGQLFSEDGQLDATLAANPYGPVGALTKSLDSLVWYGQTLKDARDAVAV